MRSSPPFTASRASEADELFASLAAGVLGTGTATAPEQAAPDERTRARQAMRAKRAAIRDIEIPAVVKPRRRAKCDRDPEFALRTWWPDLFSDPFTVHHRRMLHSIIDASQSGIGTQISRAAPRGWGKTTLFKGAAAYTIIRGIRRFPVIIEATGPFGHSTLNQLKAMFADDRYTALHEDHPEVTAPIRALEGSANRAGTQTYQSVLTHLQWSGRFCVFARIPGSKASGAAMAALGIDGAIRGLVWGALRPDLILINDPETHETVKSRLLTAEREAIIEKDIAFMGGRKSDIVIVFLGTITKRGCLADTFTDPVEQPTWDSHRIPYLEALPTATELWERYVETRQRGHTEGDRSGSAARRFYIEHREAMDEGVIATDPERFNKKPHPDGGPTELSAPHHFYNKVADLGWEAVLSEYQNAPSDELSPETSGLTTLIVQSRVSGIQRGHVPDDTDALVRMIDVHGRSLNWVVMALRQGQIGRIIDYGADPVNSPLVGRLTDPENVEAVDNAILAALLAIRDRDAEFPYPIVGTELTRAVDLTLIDSAWRQDPVYQFVKTTPGDRFRAIKGQGTARGQTKYLPPRKRTGRKRLGHHWFATYQRQDRIWLHHLDTDHWKKAVHDGFLTPSSRNGSLELYGEDAFAHRLYAAQILAEVWTQEFIPGRGSIAFWDTRSRDNHYLDATYGCLAAGAMLGIRLAMGGEATEQAATEAIKLSALQGTRR